MAKGVSLSMHEASYCIFNCRFQVLGLIGLNASEFVAVLAFFFQILKVLKQKGVKSHEHIYILELILAHACQFNKIGLNIEGKKQD